MAVAGTGYEHVALDGSGTPIIAGTTMKLVELVAEKTAYGWSPEELHFQHPYLSMGQIYSALAYYSDHKEELDRDLIDRVHLVENLRAKIQSSSFKTKIDSQKKP